MSPETRKRANFGLYAVLAILALTGPFLFSNYIFCVVCAFYLIALRLIIFLIFLHNLWPGVFWAPSLFIIPSGQVSIGCNFAYIEFGHL